MTALLTDEAIEAERTLHFDPESRFTFGARFARSIYEAQLAEDAKVRLDLMDYLEVARAWLSSDASDDLKRRIDAALAAAEEIE
ncbi:MAG: hypothetical protein IT382_22780 [Deltaproteobacteria bacterium]|nr:hypothetical protein [Deltaproteobacteria bacterium]